MRATPSAHSSWVWSGFSSRLVIPINQGGRTVGQLEAYRRNERPWSRFEIGRARIIALQLGATLERISR